MKRASEELQLPHWIIAVFSDKRLSSGILAGGE
jgi:hypothetical protein